MTVTLFGVAIEIFEIYLFILSISSLAIFTQRVIRVGSLCTVWRSFMIISSDRLPARLRVFLRSSLTTSSLNCTAIAAGLGFLEKTYFLRQIVSIAKTDKVRQDKSGVREAGIKLET